MQDSDLNFEESERFREQNSYFVKDCKILSEGKITFIFVEMEYLYFKTIIQVWSYKR